MSIIDCKMRTPNRIGKTRKIKLIYLPKLNYALITGNLEQLHDGPTLNSRTNFPRVLTQSQLLYFEVYLSSTFAEACRKSYVFRHISTDTTFESQHKLMYDRYSLNKNKIKIKKI